MRNTLPAVLLLALAIMLSACGTTQQTTFYTLGPVAAEQTAAASGGPKVSVAAVTIPEFLDRPQLVLPGESPKVNIMETHRWAEPLKNAIPRIIADNLSGRLGADKVSYSPQYASIKSDYRVFVDIRQFGAKKGLVTVEALITVKPATDGAAVITRRSLQTATFTGEGYGPMVEAYSSALDRLAGELADALPKKTD